MVREYREGVFYSFKVVSLIFKGIYYSEEFLISSRVSCFRVNELLTIESDRMKPAVFT